MSLPVFHFQNSMHTIGECGFYNPLF